MRRRYLEGVGCLLVAVGAALLVTEPGMRWTARALEGGRELAVAVGLLEEPEAPPPPSESEEEEQDDRMMGDDEQLEMLRTITTHCLPKLVCELYSKQLRSQLTESEVSLMSLIGVTALNPTGPSKYHYAAHMGQLIRGVEGGGCHHFFPSCPFNGDDVRHIARKIKV